MNDIELMRYISQGNENALAELYNQYGGAVYGLALRILEHQALAEEVTQDVFMRVWQNAYQWDSNKGSLGGWLLQIARVRSIDYLRQEKRKPVTTEIPDDEWFGIAAEPFWEDGHVLHQFMQQLPTEQQEAVYLAFFRGMTHREISETTAIPLGTVKTRLRLGLQKLKDLWVETVEG